MRRIIPKVIRWVGESFGIIWKHHARCSPLIRLWPVGYQRSADRGVSLALGLVAPGRRLAFRLRAPVGGGAQCPSASVLVARAKALLLLSARLLGAVESRLRQAPDAEPAAAPGFRAVDAQTEACDVEPLDSSVSDTARIA